MREIDGSKCNCGRQVVPARRYCPDCQRVMAPAKLPASGVVETHTTIHVPPEGFEPPIHVAVVRVADPPAAGKPAVRVLARTKQSVAIGDKVKLTAQGEVLWAEDA